MTPELKKHEKQLCNDKAQGKDGVCWGTHQGGAGRRVIVRVPPDSLVDVDVLNEEGYQQVDEEQEFKEQAPV